MRRLLGVLGAVSALGLAFFAGLWLDTGLYFLRRSEVAPKAPSRPGLWRPTGSGQDGGDDRAEALGALPYLAGYQPPGDAEGVLVHVVDRALDGYNLVISGHGTEARLLDMDGGELYRWQLPPLDTWSEHRKPDSFDPPGMSGSYWRAARLLPGGDLLVIYDGIGVVRLDVHSRVRWARWARAHHDLELAEDGRLWLLERRQRDSDSLVGPRQIVDDQLVELDADGRLLRRLSVYEALEGSRWSALLDHLALRQDPFHSNSVHWLDGSHAGALPALARDHLLISIRELHTVAVVDPAAGQVVWALTGRFEKQHDAQLLPGGTLLVFDNRPSDQRSRVVELDPKTLQEVWSFDQGFFSKELGAVHRLGNGNTLVVESQPGRAFEVTPDRQVVWEWVSPYRVRDAEGVELVATLCDVQRHPRRDVEAWLPAR